MKIYLDCRYIVLENSIFRIYLGTYDKYNLPEDIYLHSNLITLPHEDDLDSYIMGSFDDFKKANNYLEKLLRMPIYKSNNIIEPKKPNSSEKRVNIKSVCFSGKNSK